MASLQCNPFPFFLVRKQQVTSGSTAINNEFNFVPALLGKRNSGEVDCTFRYVRAVDCEWGPWNFYSCTGRKDYS